MRGGEMRIWRASNSLIKRIISDVADIGCGSESDIWSKRVAPGRGVFGLTRESRDHPTAGTGLISDTKSSRFKGRSSRFGVHDSGVRRSWLFSWMRKSNVIHLPQPSRIKGKGVNGRKNFDALLNNYEAHLGAAIIAALAQQTRLIKRPG
jgi:hypothetical protein